METILRLLLRIEGWIYFLCGSILVYSIVKSVYVTRDLKLAVFGLEQEVAKKRLRKFVSVGISALLVMLAVIFLVSFSMTKYPGLNSLATPTVYLATTQTPLTGFGFTQPDSTSGEAEVAAECSEGRIEWISPANNSTIDGEVELIGTVQVDSFAFYRYSYRKSDAAEWTIIAVGTNPVFEDTLGNDWNTTEIDAGEYQLGLFVYDSSNRMLPACVINVTIPYQ